jgi:thiamine biosynthesis lipoprotein
MSRVRSFPGAPGRAAAAALAVTLAAALACRRGADEFRSFEGEAMATRWEVLLADRPGAAEAAAAVFSRLVALDRELSEWKPGSPLSAVNRAAGGEPVEVPEDLFRLLERALEIGRVTDGAFDVTWAALWGLWDFRSPSPRLPDAAAVSARAALVDYRRVELDAERRTVRLPAAGMLIGFGGIAKGYALDRVAEMLTGAGFDDFLVTGGGQVLARGRRGDRPWRVGVRDPRGGQDEIFARVEVGDASLSTSADNESYFEVDGVRYHHVLDPRTGWPARGVRSATVLHPDAALADALSTAVMVLGSERGLAAARQLGAEALVVDEGGAVAATGGWGERLELLRSPRR